jgi:hypothetical protein
MCCLTFFDFCFNGNHNFVELVVEFLSPCMKAAVFTHLYSTLLDRIRNALGNFPTDQISQVFRGFVDTRTNLIWNLNYKFYSIEIKLSTPLSFSPTLTKWRLSIENTAHMH